MRVVSAACLCLVLLSEASWAHAQSPSTKQLACTAAEAVVRAVASGRPKRPVIFDIDPEQLEAPLINNGWFSRKKNAVRKPPIALVARLRNIKATSAIASCSNIRNFLISQNIAFGADAVKAATNVGVNFAYKADIAGVSLPLVSDNGREAVILTHSVSGRLGGGGYAEYLRLNAEGKWAIIATKMLWVS